MLYMLIALVMGFCTPLQTAANSRMRQLVSSAPLSTLISFAVSTIVLVIVALFASIPLIPSQQSFHDAPWWSWFIGVIPLITITIAIHLFKEIGQLQAMVIPMFSQLIFSLCIDHFGWFGSRVMPMNWQRAIGAALLIVGVTMVVIIPRLKSKNATTDNGGLRQVMWQLAAVLSGCLSAVVGAILASLGQVIGSAIQATTVLFAIATGVMIVFCCLNGSVIKVRKAFTTDAPWWIWMGGILGAIIVYGNAWLIPLIGVSVFMMALLIGQLLLSLLMEKHGWLGAPKKHISWTQFAGILIMLAGVFLIKF
ncbi:MAG: DMT family transporter [Muribaculaceae bacterium]|nr:DMT family transporter [Muribaculaceae bacterium]